MKVILETYRDKFIDFEDEEIDIDALENEEGNYSKVHTVCVKKSVKLFCSAMFWLAAKTWLNAHMLSASCQGHNVNV